MPCCRLLLLPLLVLPLSGCGGDSAGDSTHGEAASPEPTQNESGNDPAPPADSPEAVPANSESPVSVEVISNGEADSEEPVAAQHRSPRIVIAGAETQEQFESAAREYFEKVAAEIEATVPDSKNKRIDLRAYDSEVDAKSGNLCILHASNIASLRKPSWKKAYLDWRWRLPEFQPTREKLQIHAEYRKLRESVEDLADAQKQICEKHGLTVEQFIELHAYMMIWHSGGTPEGETLELWKKDLLSKQQP
ncbi:MAG: hypothetical protein H8E37_02160 [Planctomycetes bacterium]|nr:hypothetical protein [Planctomycetota bacterium]